MMRLALKDPVRSAHLVIRKESASFPDTMDGSVVVDSGDGIITGEYKEKTSRESKQGDKK